MRDRQERQVVPSTPIGDIAAGFFQKAKIPKSSKAVSYTHLTLPTKA